jgi:hypothetical protein
MRQGKGRSKGAKRKNNRLDADNGFAALHRGRFLDWNPQGIVAIGCTQDGLMAAVVREHGSIEIWDTEQCCKLKVAEYTCIAAQDAPATCRS